MLISAAARPALDAVLHGVLDERLEAEERHDDGQHLGRDADRHGEPVAEPGLLDDEVGLDRPQLLRERRELAVPAEGVAGELGEVDEQLPGPLGVGARERRDGGQRVVDEVRADLRPQRAHLGLHEPRARGVELGQLELPGDPARHLVRRADESRRGPAGEDLQGADDLLVDVERRDDRLAHDARRLGARDVGAVDDGRTPVAERTRRDDGGLRGRGASDRRPTRAAPLVSVIATAGAPRSERRCLSERSAAAGVRPIRSGGDASSAVCRVRYVARSASVPR